MDAFFEDFMRDVPRGDSTRSLRQQSAPQARWMRLSDIAAATDLAYDPRKPGKKVLIGAIGSRLVGIEDDRHLMTVAGSRSGKSVGLIGNLCFYRGSVLATDPKGELARLTAKKRAAMGQRVYVLDPFGIASPTLRQWRASYNPMCVLKAGSMTLLEDAALIAEAIVIQSADQKDPHWDDSARNFIEGVIVHVATFGPYRKRRTLITVRELVGAVRKLEPLPEGSDPKAKRRPLLLAEMLDNAALLEADPETADIGSAVRRAAEGFYGKAENEFAGVVSTIDRHTKFLDYTAFRSILGGSDFRLEDLKAAPEGMTLYLCFPAMRVDLSKRWMRIFVNQMLDAMERETAKPAAPVLACLDEFPALGYMKQLETASGMIASFDVKLWVFLQDWSQGKALYGDRWETFAGNAGVIQFFGNNDLTTTDYVAKRLGKTKVQVERFGEVTHDDRDKGKLGGSDSVELHDLLTADEVMRQFARDDRLKRQLVLWAGHHPMMLQRVQYYDRKGPLASFL